MEYELKSIIGSGSFGKVYKALNSKTSQIVAIKVLQLDTSDLDIPEIIAEISSMQQCASQFISKYYSSFVYQEALWIVIEFAACGSLRSILDSGYLDCFDEQTTFTIARDTLNGIMYLHDTAHIIHRDIKAANILMGCDGEIKLCDFGISVSFQKGNPRQVTFAGSPYWMSPEVINQTGYDYKSDIWSFGITLFELLTGKPPFFELNPEQALIAITRSKPARLSDPKFTLDIQNLMGYCLQDEPIRRLTAKALLNCKSVKTKGNLSGFAALYLTVKVPDEAPVENTWDNKSIRSVYSAWNFDAKSIRKASRKSLVFGRKSQLPKSRMDDVTESHNEIHEGMDDDRMSHISMQSFRKSQLSMHSKVMSDISLNSKETNDLGLRLDTCEEMEKEYDGHEDEEQEYDTTLSTNRLKLMKNKIPRKPIDHTSRFSRNGMQDLIPSRAGRVYGALWITRNHVE